MKIVYKLNLHAHTRFSDGSDELIIMAKAYKEQGFTAAVFTDHVYRNDGIGNREGRGYTLNSKTIVQAREEAKVASRVLDFPVIVGAEFTIGYMDEFLVFGSDAITDLLRIRDNYGEITFTNLEYMRNKYNMAVILAHPHQPESFAFQDLVDGFELANHGAPMFSKKSIPNHFKDLTPWSNSDAHWSKGLSWGYNWIDEFIKSEEQLITFIKEKAPIKMYMAFTDYEKE